MVPCMHAVAWSKEDGEYIVKNGGWKEGRKERREVRRGGGRKE